MKDLTPELKEAFESLAENCFPVGGMPCVGWHQIGKEAKDEFIEAFHAAYALGSEKDKQLRYDYEAAVLRIQELEKQVSELRNEISGYEAEDYNRQIGEI